MPKKILLNETDWLPVFKVGYTVDGRYISDEMVNEIYDTYKNYNNFDHLPFWNKGHIKDDWFGTADARPRLGTVSDLKVENGVVYIKSNNLDKDFVKEIKDGKYPHISAEIGGAFAGKEKDSQDNEIDVWKWKFNGVAAIAWNAAFPGFRTVEFSEKHPELLDKNGFIDKNKLNDIDKPLMYEKAIEGTDKKAFCLVSLNKFEKGEQEFMANKVTETLKEDEKLDTIDTNVDTEQTKTEDFTEKPTPKKKVSKSTDNLEQELFEDGVLDKQTGYASPEVKKYNEIVEMYNNLLIKNKRLQEDKINSDVENKRLKTEIEALEKENLELDFLTTVLDHFQQGKITAAALDLDIPTNQISGVKDYIKYSAVFRDYWKDPLQRKFVLNQWNDKEKTQFMNKPYGSDPIEFSKKKDQNIENIIIEVAEKRCKQNGIELHSDKGLDIQMDVYNEYNNDKNLFMKRYYE